MPRPRSNNPSPAALRQRKARARKADPDGAVRLTVEDVGAIAKLGRLVPVTVHVPPQDVQAMRLAAVRFRRIARVPESEVPE